MMMLPTQPVVHIRMHASADLKTLASTLCAMTVLGTDTEYYSESTLDEEEKRSATCASCLVLWDLWLARRDAISWCGSDLRPNPKLIRKAIWAEFVAKCPEAGRVIALVPGRHLSVAGPPYQWAMIRGRES